MSRTAIVKNSHPRRGADGLVEELDLAVLDAPAEGGAAVRDPDVDPELTAVIGEAVLDRVGAHAVDLDPLTEPEDAGIRRGRAGIDHLAGGHPPLQTIHRHPERLAIDH